MKSFKEQAVHSLPNHFTASAVVIEKGHILLIHHKRIGAWLPPGGHIDAGEIPHQTAVREVFEETGVAVTVLSEQMPRTDSMDALFPPQPLCLHVVKATEKGEELYHLDLAYVCKTTEEGKSLPAIRHTDEVHEARWVRLDEIERWHLASNVLEVVELAKAKLKLQNIL